MVLHLGIYFRGPNIVPNFQDTCNIMYWHFWLYADGSRQLRALILYRRRRFINHLLTYLLTCLLNFRVARYHMICIWGVKSNPIFGFRIPIYPIHCVTFMELS